MEDQEKTPEQLIRELEQIRRQAAALEASKAELERTAEGLRENVDRLNLALKSSEAGTWSLDVPRGICTWDDYLPPLFGLPPGTLKGSYQEWLELVHPDDRQRTERECARCLEEIGELGTEYRVTWPDGSVHFIASQGKVYADQRGQAARMTGVCWDITERKRAEHALQRAHDELEQRVQRRTRELRESEERYRTLIETVPHGIQEIDTTGMITFCNAAYHRMLGYEREEVLGRYAWDVLTDETQKGELQSYLKELVETQPPVTPYFKTNVTGQGTLVDVQVDWNYKRDETGAVVGFISVITDATKRRKAEQELRVSEERFRQLAENIEEVFWLSSPDRKEMIYVSPAYEKTWGRSCESLYKDPSSWLDAVVEEDREAVVLRLKKRIEGDFVEPAGPVYRIARPDGSICWILTHVFPVRNESGEVYRVAGIAEDITEQKQAEQKLESEQRLLRDLFDLQERERQLVAHEIHDGFVQDVVSAGMMLEGVLHELKSQNWPGTGRFQSVNEMLTRAIAEGRRMISDLRPMIIDEEGVVAAIEHLVADEYSDPPLRVELSFLLKSDRLDSMLEGTIFRIVQEALINAKRHSGCDAATVELTHDGGRLLLEIRDRGVGFDPGRVSSERFGLRGIRERARLFGGHATIESAPGEGTRIAVEWPLVADAANPGAEGRHPL